MIHALRRRGETMKKKKLKRIVRRLREYNTYLLDEERAIEGELETARRRVNACDKACEEGARALALASSTLADISRVLGARPGETALEAAKWAVAVFLAPKPDHAEVQEAWGLILGFVENDSPALAAVLRKGKLRRLDARECAIEYPMDSFAGLQANTPEAKGPIAKAASRIMGVQPHVVIVFEEKPAASTMPHCDPPPAAYTTAPECVY